MKRSIAAVVLLLGIIVCLNVGAQESDPSAYHLVVIDRAKCPGEAVQISEPLAVIAHGQTGYYIVFGKGPVTVPSGGVVVMDLTSRNPAVIDGYLSDPSFQRYVSSPKVLEGFKFAVKSVGK
jgi:hypothetical protein